MACREPGDPPTQEDSNVLVVMLEYQAVALADLGMVVSAHRAPQEVNCVPRCRHTERFGIATPIGSFAIGRLRHRPTRI